jgi:hypothetical protein
VETAVRVRLLDAATGRAVWQHNYVRSYPIAGVDKFLEPFETLAVDSPTQHRLKEFKEDHGARWFHDELNQTVSALSEEIANLFPAAESP